LHINACLTINFGFYLYSYQSRITSGGYLGELYPLHAGYRSGSNAISVYNSTFSLLDHGDSLIELFLVDGYSNAPLSKMLRALVSNTTKGSPIYFSSLVVFGENVANPQIEIVDTNSAAGTMTQTSILNSHSFGHYTIAEFRS
jgi:hypothetical protein